MASISKVVIRLPSWGVFHPRRVVSSVWSLYQRPCALIFTLPGLHCAPRLRRGNLEAAARCLLRWIAALLRSLR